LEEVHQYFVAEQESMRRQLSRSSIKYRELNADDSIGSNVEDAYEFWLS
jgi:hypothetical protein